MSVNNINDEFAISSIEEDVSKCSDTKFQELEKGDSGLLAKRVNVEPSSSAIDDTNVAETIRNTGTLTIDNESHTQTVSECLLENIEETAICGLEDEFNSDTQEEEIKLRWDDDDEDDVELHQKTITTGSIKEACEDKLMKTDEILSKEAEVMTSVTSSITSQTETFVETSILLKKDHGVNKPDVMLDIPGLLPDMGDELENMHLEISYDNEKEPFLEDTDKSLSELLLKVNAGITETSSSSSSLVCKLEMSSDTEDDSPKDIGNTNKTNLVEAIEKEVKLLSDTMSSIEGQDYMETKSESPVEIAHKFSPDNINVMEPIKHEVESSVNLLPNIELEEPLKDVPITDLKLFAEPSTNTEKETNILEPHNTLSEQREKDMNLKVSSLISSIEKEMQLLDSTDEMETETCEIALYSDTIVQKQLEKKKDLNPSDPINIEATKISTKVDMELNIEDEIPSISQAEPKNKELNEHELREKEQDEIALAVKTIEQENEIYESTPATVTIVNVENELSEISVLEEDNEPSISLVLDDDDESIEVLQQNLVSLSTPIDESEVSIIQDSDDERPILVPDVDEVSTANILQTVARSSEIQEENSNQSSLTVDNEVFNTESKESVTSDINKVTKYKCLSLKRKCEIEQKTTENVNVALQATSVQTLDKQDQHISDVITTMEGNYKTMTTTLKEKPTDNVKIDEVSICEEENDVKDNNKLIESNKSNTNETAKCLHNINVQSLSNTQNASKETTEMTSIDLEQEKNVVATKQNAHLLEMSYQNHEIESQPSTSTVELDLNKDSSNDVPDSDALGLLAESTRVMHDDDDEDDDDFYHDDESNLMTAEHSEDSNQHSDDAQEVPDVMESEEKEITKQTDIVSPGASVVSNQDQSEYEMDTSVQREDEFQFSINNVTNDVQKERDSTDAIECDVELETKSVEGGEKNTETKNDTAPIESEETVTESVTTQTSDNEGKTAKSQESAAVPPEKENKSPHKTMNLTISSRQAVWNFVDLEESSEDEIQVVQKTNTTKQSAPQLSPAQPEAQEQPAPETHQEEPKVTSDVSTPDTVTEPKKDVSVEVLDEEMTKDVPKDAASKTSAVEEDKPTVDSETQTEKTSSLEVFTLDSDDEEPAVPPVPAEAPPTQPEPESSKRDFKCVNSNCQYAPGVGCFVADAATVAYYDGDKRRRTFVCEDCWQPVQKRNEELMEGIRTFTPLLELDMNTFSLDLVEISDSDSDGEPDPEDQESEKIGEDAAKYLEDNLADMLNKTWLKYHMDSRLAETESVLKMELRSLENECKKIQSSLHECQATTDKIRNELYASFPQETRQLPPLVLYDTPEQQYCYVQTSLQSTKDGETIVPTPTRMSKRRLEAAANAEIPAKRPAIPLGYTPLDALERLDNKIGADGMEKVDDDNMDVSVVNIISSEAAPPGLPPPGELVKPQLRIGMTVYAMRNSFGSWVKGKILEIMPKGTQSLTFTTCKVKFDNKQKTPVKTVLARCMAYSEPASVRLTIGTRVIANFKDTKDNREPQRPEAKRESYFSGIVAEVPNPVNNYRYLIFFDDGYAQYASHADTRLVCECATLVWEEVHPFSREFVREYLLAYPERPMVRLHPYQSLKTEWNGKWWTSRVVAVDASLAQVHFPANNRYEWIYRGSTRLAPLYLELQAAERHRSRPMPRTQAHSRANMPVVEYTRYDEQSNKTFEIDLTTQQQRQEEANRQRAVARKSTGAAAAHPAHPAQATRPPPGQNLDNVTSRVVPANEQPGHLMYYTPKNAVKPHKMVPHSCGPHCKRTDVLALKDLRTYNPLAKPLLSGWERQIVRNKGQRAVAYRAPCGRRIRCIRELHRYLRATDADLPVDLFDFSPLTHCLAEFVLNKCIIMKKDLSQGKENVPVPCVNYYDDTLPEFCLYNTERTPTTGVPLNLDPEFLCGCDCEDDCEDKTKCACWKLTLEGARTIGLEGDNVGYVYKRLPEPLPSGIYECNSRCKCKHTCLNRVAQHPLQLKLQIFKTLNRGWGIRALNDVPKGSFLCVYAGNLLTDATANLDGLNEGDEYLAELDYIEVVEQMKEGYEEDIPKDLKKMSLDQNDNGDEESDQDEESSEDEAQMTSKTELEDDDFQPNTYVGIGVTQFSKRLRQRNRDKKENAGDEKKEPRKEKDEFKKEKEELKKEIEELKKEEMKKEEQKKEELKKEELKKDSERGSNDEDCITISDDDEVREPSSFAAAAGMGADAFVSKYRSVRSLFGEDEACYIMDAKVQGNIGRYLNHSCSPNVFVQNVFVDTHDPRFPWVAFFALTYVRAGTELTWNYNYDVGSVPGKTLYCYCGSANCRRRLL